MKNEVGPSDFQALVDACKANALLSLVGPNEAAQYRFVCRVYSKTFYTPLERVMELPMEHVLNAFFEEQMDKLDSEKDIEKIIEMILELKDPDYDNTKKKAQDDFDKELMERESQRLAKGLPVHPSMRGETSLLKNTIEKQDTPVENLPTRGYLNPKLFNPDEEA